jgi:glycosyltransferase involved in cell wall biosynthesis
LIVRITQLIDTLRFGGAQSLLTTFAQTAPPDVRLTVISLQGAAPSPVARDLTDLGVKVLYAPSRSLFDARPAWRVARYLRQCHQDVLHTHLTYANIVGPLAGRLAGVPVVATLHNTVIEHRRLRAPLEATALRWGTRRVIAVGDAVAHANRSRLGKATLDIIPNAVKQFPPLSPAARQALRTKLIGDAERPLLISVGRLTEQKCYSDLLTAFSDVHRTHPSAALVVAGGGPLEGQLRAQMTALGLSEHVRLLGARDDVPDLLNASDVYVSSSAWEGLPVAVLEAMAASLPIVATSVGDVPQVVIPGAGILAPAGDTAALAAGMRALIDDPALGRAMGDRAGAHIASHHSAEAWVTKLMALYADVTISNAQANPHGICTRVAKHKQQCD